MHHIECFPPTSVDDDTNDEDTGVQQIQEIANDGYWSCIIRAIQGKDIWENVQHGLLQSLLSIQYLTGSTMALSG